MGRAKNSLCGKVVYPIHFIWKEGIYSFLLPKWFLFTNRKKSILFLGVLYCAILNDESCIWRDALCGPILRRKLNKFCLIILSWRDVSIHHLISTTILRLLPLIYNYSIKPIFNKIKRRRLHSCPDIKFILWSKVYPFKCLPGMNRQTTILFFLVVYETWKGQVN